MIKNLSKCLPGSRLAVYVSNEVGRKHVRVRPKMFFEKAQV